MHPHPIFGIDSFHLILGVLLPLTFVYLAMQVRAAGYSYTRFMLLQIGLIIVALIGAKLFSAYMRDWGLHGWQWEVMNGWRYPGAVIGMLLFWPLIIRTTLPGYSIAQYCDKLAIVVAFCMAAIRINCILNGCCTGPVCDGPLCLTYAPGSAVWYEHLKHGQLAHPEQRSLTVVPLHLYFMLASLAVGVFLLWFEKRKHYAGQLVLLYLLLHEGSKALLEIWRVPHADNIQLVSVCLAVSAAIALFVLRKRRERPAP